MIFIHSKKKRNDKFLQYLYFAKVMTQVVSGNWKCIRELSSRGNSKSILSNFLEIFTKCNHIVPASNIR